MTHRGLTWDHPRGYDALAEAARRAADARGAPLIHWAKQPLAGFESAPIAGLAAAHDLLVLDHPHIGEAVAEDVLAPLEDFFTAEQIAAWERESVGPSLDSYRWGGRLWALPLDVAAQVMARRRDRVAEPPADWDAVIALAEKEPVAQSLQGPHALLTFFSIAASKGAAPGGGALIDDDAGRAALDVMAALYALRPSGSEALNPIQLSEAMAIDGAITLTPLVFGYVTYGKTLAFSNAIGRRGVLGGTGVAITKCARPDDALIAHLADLMRPETQRTLLPAFGGQPSSRSAWRDPRVDEVWGGFYGATLETAEQALLRPRFDGYVAFQTQAADRIRDALDEREPPAATLEALRALWRAARSRARGDFDDERPQS